MLSPRYLEGISDELVEIYSQLESDILADMARRIARLNKVTEATKWQAQLLKEAGTIKKDVAKLTAKYSPAIQKEITAIYNDATIKNTRADNVIFKAATGRKVSDTNAQLMLASIQKTRADLSRLTITTAYETETQFINAANAAYMQVATGAFDYDTATRNACDKLAADGITGVQYRNGKPVRLSIEAAVRMNILTGVNQTASQMTLNNCDELGCDLVETTAHIGARPEHEAWQGQIFSLSGINKKYRPFSDCRPGEIDGICGINCRHSYYPYFEGMEKHYTQKDLDAMDKPVKYNGKEYSRYDAEQKLRGMERNVRKYKRQAVTQEAAGIDNTKARRKINEWQAAARDFTEQTKIERDRTREFIGTINGKQPTGLKPAANKTIQIQTVRNEYKGLLKKYGDRQTMLNKATKKELETVKIYDATKADSGEAINYKSKFKNQRVDTAALTNQMQQSTTIEERDAFRTWTGSAYSVINDHYRNGATIDAGYMRTGEVIHNYLNKCEYPQMYVMRGANGSYLDKLTGGNKWRNDPKELLYKRITDKGFMATTPVVGGGFKAKEVLFYYKTPAKGKAAYIASLSHFETEKETLFINGTSAIIKGVEIESIAGRRRYSIFLDME